MDFVLHLDVPILTGHKRKGHGYTPNKPSYNVFTEFFQCYVHEPKP